MAVNVDDLTVMLADWPGARIPHPPSALADQAPAWTQQALLAAVRAQAGHYGEIVRRS